MEQLKTSSINSRMRKGRVRASDLAMLAFAVAVPVGTLMCGTFSTDSDKKPKAYRPAPENLEAEEAKVATDPATAGRIYGKSVDRRNNIREILK